MQELERLARLYQVPVATVMKWQQAGHKDLRPATSRQPAVRLLRIAPEPPPASPPGPNPEGRTEIPPRASAKQEPAPERPWLKVRELAEREGISTKTLWRWVSAGVVDVSRLGPRTGVRVRLRRPENA
jgi:hypothetical protein